MFREMRRTDREISTDEAVTLLQTGEYGVISVYGEEGYPYGIPMSYTFTNGNIYLHCATTGHKLDAIRKDDKVCFTVVGATELLPSAFSTNYRSTVVFGKAVILTEDQDAEKQQALEALLGKYSKDFNAEGLDYIKSLWTKVSVVRIIPDQISGKARQL